MHHPFEIHGMARSTVQATKISGEQDLTSYKPLGASGREAKSNPIGPNRD